MATRTYDRLILKSGKTYTVPSGDVITILNYTAGDWDGAIIESDAPDHPIHLNVPAGGIVVVGTKFTDCWAAGGGVIDATNGGIDGGGNDANILFTTTTTSTTVEPTTTTSTSTTSTSTTSTTSTSTTSTSTTSTTPEPEEEEDDRQKWKFTFGFGQSF